MLHRSLRFACVFIPLALLSPARTSAEEPVDKSLAKVQDGDPTLWYDLLNLRIEGKGWEQTKAPYDRFPAKAEGVVPPAVWGLSRNSAGLCARFVTDATTIKARWMLTSERLAMQHMPATGVSGVDLYVKADDGQWRWLAIGQPSKQETTATLVSNIPAGKREFLLYLPLYNGVSSVEIGIPKESTLAKAPAYDEQHAKPIMFYGTSITQGGCASRPGMVHTAILGRKFLRPVINLGFSGSGRMEPEMATLMAELDPAVFVLDCLPNMGPAEVTERVEPFVKTLRQARPATPILLVEDRNYSNSFLVTSSAARNRDSQANLRQAYDRLRGAGVEGLHYLPATHLLGDDNEGTVDSSHPTDLGFMRQADAFAEALRPILQTAK